MPSWVRSVESGKSESTRICSAFFSRRSCNARDSFNAALTPSDESKNRFRAVPWSICRLRRSARSATDSVRGEPPACCTRASITLAVPVAPHLSNPTQSWVRGNQRGMVAFLSSDRIPRSRTLPQRLCCGWPSLRCASMAIHPTHPERERQLSSRPLQKPC